jgi:hypothetical protein
MIAPFGRENKALILIAEWHFCHLQHLFHESESDLLFQTQRIPNYRYLECKETPMIFWHFVTDGSVCAIFLTYIGLPTPELSNLSGKHAIGSFLKLSIFPTDFTKFPNEDESDPQWHMTWSDDCSLTYQMTWSLSMFTKELFPFNSRFPFVICSCSFNIGWGYSLLQQYTMCVLIKNNRPPTGDCMYWNTKMFKDRTGQLLAYTGSWRCTTRLGYRGWAGTTLEPRIHSLYIENYQQSKYWAYCGSVDVLKGNPP